MKNSDSRAEEHHTEESRYKVESVMLYGLDYGDPVHQPAHYRMGGIETIDFIEAKRLGFHLGNVVKYISRAKHKGKELEDLRKAAWYLNRYIEMKEKNATDPK